MVGTGTRLTEGGQNPRGAVAWQSSRGEENKMKVQGLSEDAKTGSLARPQNGVGGVQSDYSGGREGRRKKRRKEGGRHTGSLYFLPDFLSGMCWG